jgi:hypothetical protein
MRKTVEDERFFMKDMMRIWSKKRRLVGNG